MGRALAVLAVLAACGDNIHPGPETPDEVLAKLRALPGVTADLAPTQTPGVTYILIHITQPVDHDQPDGPTFQQEVSLLHRDVALPMTVLTSGYWDYYLDQPVELTNLLGGNQVSIEHRYFGASRPNPADWSKLTIAQMAADEHAIITALRTIYTGRFLTTGGSKGGMTAMYHWRFFPEDIDGTVAYVAPISFGAPDARYATFLDSLGPQDCRLGVRAVATEMLAHRRAAMLAAAQAQTGHSYTRVKIGPAVESAIQSLEWSFWQYFGVDDCATMVPSPTASDSALFAFLDHVSPVTANDDDSVANFEAYYYQADSELGFPDGGAAYLDPYLMYTDADYTGMLPTSKPTYDGGLAMRDIDDFVQHNGDHLLFVYGEWDPWTAGKFELGHATDSLRVIQPQGTHDSRITKLAASDRDAALAKVASWSGVIPDTTSARTNAPRPPRVPPALVRALRARTARK